MTSAVESDAPRDNEVQAELERLARLRRNVANGLMALSESARRDAAALLSLGAEGPTAVAEHPAPRSGFGSWQVATAFVIGLTSGLAAMWLLAPQDVTAPRLAESLSPTVAAPGTVDGDGPISATADVSGSDAAPMTGAELPAAPAPPSPAVADRLVVSLSASSLCWIRTTVDGGEPVERTLAAGDAIVLEADREVALRVGDAGAVSLRIDGQPARSLGAAGQVVSASITRANVDTFLAR